MPELFLLNPAGPEVTIQVIQDLETPLMELVAQLVGQCNTDDFCIMLRLVLEGLDVCNVWKQNTEVGDMFFF